MRAIFGVGAHNLWLLLGTVWYTARCVHIWRYFGSLKNALHEIGTRTTFLIGADNLLSFGEPCGTRPCAFTFWRHVGFFKHGFQEIGTRIFFDRA